MDTNLASFADRSGLLVEDHLFRPADWAGSSAGKSSRVIDDSLKCSHLADSIFRRCTSYGGCENALDCNRICARLRFEDCKLIGGDQAGIVIKGGCSDIVFPEDHPTELIRDADGWCDVLIDDWSDQSQAISCGIDLRGLRRADGAKVRIVVGRGWSRVLPLMPSNAEILLLKSVGVHAYNLGRGAAWRLGVR